MWLRFTTLAFIIITISMHERIFVRNKCFKETHCLFHPWRCTSWTSLVWVCTTIFGHSVKRRRRNPFWIGPELRPEGLGSPSAEPGIRAALRNWTSDSNSARPQFLRLGAMDKALACYAGGWGSNPDTTKVYSAPILSVTSAMCTLSLTMAVVICYSLNTCHGEGKKRGIMVKS